MVDKASDQVGVIGGGLGGLATACALAARGYRVILFEGRAELGGKAAVLEDAGYRFDMGPTILTLPAMLRRIFTAAGRRLEDYLELVRLDPQWRSFFADGATLDLFADASGMSRELDRFAAETGQTVPSMAAAYQHFLRLAARMHDVSNRYFFSQPVDSLGDMFRPGSMLHAATIGDVLALRPGRTVAGTIRALVHDPRVAQMLDHFTQYVGSAPDQSPAVLCGIAHMQTSEGVWYPRGGIGAVPRALERLAGELGVEFETGTPVSRIDTRDGAVRGVLTDDGRHVPLAAVVSNADAVRTHRELLQGTPAHQTFDRRRRYEPACSGVVLYLGLDRRYAHLAHHNFVFSRDAHREFETIYRQGRPTDDPTCYVCAPAATDPSVAPPGGEALYVLVHTPYLRPDHHWRELFPSYRRTILRKLAECAGLIDLERRIVCEQALTPQDIHDRYRVLNGAIYGLASHGRFTGAFKPNNRSRAVRGLYLAGGAAHPGPGMPMVLLSGWLAAEALDHDGLATPNARAQASSQERVHEPVPI